MVLPALVDGIDISAIRLFLAAVDLGSVSKAAVRLQISQPSATAKLRKLERQLGATLLERSSSGSVPTADGVRLAPACAELLTVATSLVDRADSLDGERTVLRIAATRHVADHFLPEWVSRGVAHGVRLEMTELDTMGVAQALRSGEVMVGFVEGPHPPLGLRSAVVVSERVVAVVGRSHEWYGRSEPVPAPELMSATLVLGHPGSGTRDVVVAAFGAYEWGAVGEHVDVASASAARLAALDGTGVAFLPRCWVHDRIASGDLSVLVADDLEIEQPVRVAWRGRAPSTGTARRFVERLTV